MRTLEISSAVCFAFALSTFTASRAQAQQQPEIKVVAGAPVRQVVHLEEPIPDGFHREHRLDKGFLFAGVGSFAIGYVAAALTAIPSANQGGGVLLVPFAGPFLMMGNVRQDGPSCDAGKTLCVDSRGQVGIDGYLAIMGAAQIIGAGLFVTAFIARHAVIVPNEKAALRNVQVAPIVTSRFAGVGISGSF